MREPPYAQPVSVLSSAGGRLRQALLTCCLHSATARPCEPFSHSTLSATLRCCTLHSRRSLPELLQVVDLLRPHAELGISTAANSQMPGNEQPCLSETCSEMLRCRQCKRVRSASCRQTKPAILLTAISPCREFLRPWIACRCHLTRSGRLLSWQTLWGRDMRRRSRCS